MMIDWQPISTAPKDGTRVLLAAIGHEVGFGVWEEDKGRTLIAADEPYWEPYDHSSWNLEYKDGKWFEPTHWAPWPEPPSA